MDCTTVIKFKCQFTLNQHLKLIEIYMKSIYTYGLIDT
jgi:hypothetical protein